MIQPLRADDEFLADVAAAQQQADRLHLWWLGQSGFLVQWQGQHLLLDPYLSDSLTQKYANTDKPHIRMTARVVAPAALDLIDVVTSSHNHTDHLDAETLLPLIAVNPQLKLVIPAANRRFVATRLGCDPAWPYGLDDGLSTTVGVFTLTGIPAAHDELELDEIGRHKFLGMIIQAGPWTIYHSGDTRLYAGLAERLQRFKIDVALLPINGHSPERRVAGNLTGVEAAQLAKSVNVGLVIPCHFDLFSFNSASPEPFISECARLQQPYLVLRAGEGWHSPQT